MTITLELPPALEQELAAEAARLHMPLEDYVLHVLEDSRVTESESYPVGQVIINPPRAVPDALAEARAQLGPDWPRTGAELVAYWEREGLLGTRPDIIDSAEYARALRRRAEQRGHD